MADLRNKTQNLLQSAFSNMGMSNERSLELAQDFAGRPEADTILKSLGVLDFTPAGLVFGAQDAYRDFGKAETPSEYGMATGMMALSGLEAFPATKGIAKYLKNVVKPKTNTIDNVDLSKRQTVKTLGALPAAAVVADPVVGALSKLGDAPVAKTVAKAVPSNTFSNFMRNLYAGIVPDKKTAELIQDNIDNIQQNMRDDGLINTPDYEDLDVAFNDLEKIVNNDQFPAKMELHTSAEDLYKNNVIENIDSNYRGDEEFLEDMYDIKLDPEPEITADVTKKATSTSN